MSKKHNSLDDVIVPGYSLSRSGFSVTRRVKSETVVSKRLTNGEREYLAWLADRRTGAGGA